MMGGPSGRTEEIAILTARGETDNRSTMLGLAALLLARLGREDETLEAAAESAALGQSDDAVTQLLRIQAIDASKLPAYDEAFLARELHLFEEWFLGRHLGVTLDCGDMERLEVVYRRLIDNALAQPQVFVHRDFMPRNLLPVANGPAVIDFQGALRGPIAYDAISLYRDAFLSWPEGRVERGLKRYHERALAAGWAIRSLLSLKHDHD